MAANNTDRSGHRYLRIGKFQVLAHIATGGMGAVYKAEDTELHRVVALKVLSPDLSTHPVRRERFRREALHSAKLNHENIVRTYEWGEENDHFYLALEFIDGIDLFEHIKRKGKLSGEETREILVQAVRALDHAHQQRIIHRDIKPPNILLAQKRGKLLVKLTDFGLAREAHDDDFRVTQTGHTVGTIDYMAPEQARNSRMADARSDIYSLGCTVFHMLAGRAPFAEGTMTERVFKHCEAPVPDLRHLNPAVPSRLLEMMERMLAKKPENRYQTPAELLADLNRREISSVRPRPRSSGIAGGADPAALAKAAVPTARAPSTFANAPGSAQVERRSEKELSPYLLVRGEHVKKALAQYERARQALAKGSFEYAIDLLLGCCRLDPTDLLYRKTLREVEQTARQQQSWRSSLGWLSSRPDKTRLLTACRTNDHRSVLEHGEEVLACSPEDLEVHKGMVEAAGAVGLERLALWLLEQAHATVPSDLPLARDLARRYEQKGNRAAARAVWEVIAQADPDDNEATRKLRDLAPRENRGRGRRGELVKR